MCIETRLKAKGTNIALIAQGCSNRHWRTTPGHLWRPMGHVLQLELLSSQSHHSVDDTMTSTTSMQRGLLMTSPSLKALKALLILASSIHLKPVTLLAPTMERAAFLSFLPPAVKALTLQARQWAGLAPLKPWGLRRVEPQLRGHHVFTVVFLGLHSLKESLRGTVWTLKGRPVWSSSPLQGGKCSASMIV